MSEKDDLDWLDALAGRHEVAQAQSEDSPAAWEARALRLAILARTAHELANAPAQDDERETDLIVRARREGLLVDASELAGNPFARRSSWRSAIRATGLRGFAAAALAIAVLTLGWHMRPEAPVEAVFRGSPDGIVHLKASDPRSLKQQIVEELRAAGVQATGYEQLGVNGIDADLPHPVPDEVRRLLARHRIPVPTDGVLRIEIAAPEGQ